MTRKGTFLVFVLWVGAGILGWSFVQNSISHNAVSHHLVSDKQQSYIIQAESAEAAAAIVARHGGVVTSFLPVVNGVGALLTAETAVQLSQEAGIVRLTPNYNVEVAGNPNQPTADYAEVVAANQVWATGNTGQGVTIAVLDSGAEYGFNSLKKNTAMNHRILAWQDFVGEQAAPVDLHGHGSHVAGIIAGSDTGPDGQWNGIAPDTNLVVGRVLNDQGLGTYEGVIAGIQWVIDHKSSYNIRILNLSLVGQAQVPYWADPLNQAVMQAWAEGIVVVAAAGNGGPEPMTVGVPGNNPYVITVGAFTDAYTPDDWGDDYLTPFSAAGPTLDGFAKPDVVAPGAHMVARVNKHSYLSQTYADNQLKHEYFSMAGTSQATAVVSGIIALMLSHDPALTPDQVKYRLMHSALLWTSPATQAAQYSLWQQGAGRVHAPAAVFAGATESANMNLNIEQDLADAEGGYAGYSYFDEASQTFRLYDDPAIWPDGYSVWAGGYSIWAGGYSIWAGGYSIWSGGYSVWAGDYGLWAGGYSVWAGGYSIWAGGYSIWAGGYPGWTAKVPWAEPYSQPAFAATYAAGVVPENFTATSSFGGWVDDNH